MAGAGDKDIDGMRVNGRSRAMFLESDVEGISDRAFSAVMS